MTRYILSRLVAMCITLFIILTIAFMVVRLMPGSVYDNPEYSIEIIQALEAKAQLDKPWIIQYFHFLKGALRGDWGVSVKIAPCVPVFDVIKQRIPITILLNIISLVISLPIGILAGTVAAMNRSRMPDHIISFLVVNFISVPSFVFATLMQYFLAFKAGWFPIVYSATAAGTAKYRSMMLPMLALSFGPIATVTRYLRGELIENLSSEYMLLARTKGLTKYQAAFRHAFRNSCVPLANIIIPMFTGILGGSLVVERIFAIPGVGGLMVESVSTSDHFLTVAVLLFYSVISLFTILLVDISYGIIDPRIRLGGNE
ncbi:MAG: ABC transporter permease [Firmicutes bacterium]|nr:ABC transporter permease [Candidatus Fermentithermobacillaceae bacterium]